jgi:hypothetical protein
MTDATAAKVAILLAQQPNGVHFSEAATVLLTEEERTRLCELKRLGFPKLRVLGSSPVDPRDNEARDLRRAGATRLATLLAANQFEVHYTKAPGEIATARSELWHRFENTDSAGDPQCAGRSLRDARVLPAASQQAVPLVPQQLPTQEPPGGIAAIAPDKLRRYPSRRPQGRNRRYDEGPFVQQLVRMGFKHGGDEIDRRRLKRMMLDWLSQAYAPDDQPSDDTVTRWLDKYWPPDWG